MRIPIIACAVSSALLSTQAMAQECSRSPKEVVEGFLRLMHVEKKPRQAFEAFVSNSYIEHSPWLEGDLEAIISFREFEASANPEDTTLIKRLLADGDYIIVHSHSGIRPSSPASNAVMEIFRVENCKIAEHWDVTQPVPIDVPNPNGMF